MAVHMVAVAKLKLLAGGGHSNWKLLAALLCPFALKLPFFAQFPSSCTDIAVSVRLFLFRLNRIFFDDSIPAVGRWRRALRLLHDRANADEGMLRMVRVNEEMLNALSMLAL
uniref:Uncharacterized protein n=1 Tax=Ananas comosus var. bracteatus TaxID=296719 RepID=A0A6V7QMS2_ANACO|nr:unnamed protein product [Ananas comosus var. bracteatus]